MVEVLRADAGVGGLTVVFAVDLVLMVLAVAAIVFVPVCPVFVLVLDAGPFTLGRRLNKTSGEGSPATKLLAARTPLDIALDALVTFALGQLDHKIAQPSQQSKANLFPFS